MAQLFAVKRQEQLYTANEVAHFERSKYAKKYVDRKATASPSTASTYRTHTAALAQFIYRTQEQAELDDFVDSIKAGKHNPYDVLADFAAFITRERTGDKKIKPNSLRVMVKVAKRFLKFSGCPITNEDFKEQVSLPRRESVEKKAVDKRDVITILNAAQDVRLKTYLMYEAAYGPRPLENAALRNRDVDLEKETVTFRADFSKMRVARTRRMTKELAQQTKLWLAEKYRPYRTTVNERKVWRAPKANPEDLFFAPYHVDGKIPQPKTQYNQLGKRFHDLLSSISMGSWEENGRRREITQNSLRRFAKTAISDLGFSDYSEWWIGHENSTYYRKSEREREEMFRKIEPYLTFLDVAGLEAHSADIEAQLKVVKEQTDRQIRVLTQSYEQKLQDMEARFMRELEARKEGFESQKALEQNKERLIVEVPTTNKRA